MVCVLRNDFYAIIKLSLKNAAVSGMIIILKIQVLIKAKEGLHGSGKEISKGSGTDPGAGQTRVIWDDSNMRSVYANATNVAGGREEIVLLFGMNQAWHAGQKEIRIQLSDRVILSPLPPSGCHPLNNVLKDYESRYGLLDIGTPQAPPTSTVQ
jgi:hypothetical protein